MAQQLRNLPEMQEIEEMWVPSLGQEDSLGEEMATHSNIVTLGRLQSMGSLRAPVGRLYACLHTYGYMPHDQFQAYTRAS